MKIRGPITLEEPYVVYKGESFKPLTRVTDGVKTAAKPLGAAVDLSAGTVEGIMRIDKPDGTADLVLDTATSSGSKVDEDGEGFEHAFSHLVADTVTATWALGLHAFEVEYQDSGPTIADKILVSVGFIDVREKPSLI